MTDLTLANHCLPAADHAAFVQAHTAQRKALESRKRRDLRKKKRLSATKHTEELPRYRSRSPRQRIGDAYEAQAQTLLERAGLRIIDRQVSCPAGEIDLVACEQDILVFVEVRARSALSHGSAAASITRSKQDRLLRAIKWCLPRLTQQHFGGTIPQCRIDVVTFDPGGVQWLSDAIRPELGK